MIIESKNVFLVHPKNEHFIRGEMALPYGWNRTFLPFLLIKLFLLQVAVGLVMKWSDADGRSFLVAVAVASFVYLVYGCVAQTLKKAKLKAAVKRGRFIFTDDYKISFFNDESSNCVIKFSFPHSQMLSGQEQGEGRRENLKPGMCLCALFIDNNRFFVM